jgi:excisionase family DNA binding protein
MTRETEPQVKSDPEWMDLKSVQKYVEASERTIRDWIHNPVNPLPAVQVQYGKILIKRSKLDSWLEQHPIQPINSLDVDAIADEVLNSLGEAA